MKIKFNVLAAAALVLASSVASAAINVTATPDLLLVAYDPFTASTYVRDLGVSLSALNTSQTFNAPASSIFATQFAGVAASAIQWNVVSLNDANSNAPTTYTTGDITTFAGILPSDVVSSASILTGPLGGFTQLDLAANGFAKPNGEYTGVKNASDQTNGAVLANAFGYGFPVSGQGVGSSQNFLKTDSNGDTTQLFLNASLAAFNNNAKGGYFTLLDAAGDLSWTNGSVAAVPLPGAALLFGPGLLAMMGLTRRRQNKQA